MSMMEVDGQMEENSNLDSKPMRRGSDNNGDLMQENDGPDSADTHDQLDPAKHSLGYLYILEACSSGSFSNELASASCCYGVRRCRFNAANC
ncbi:hypothetical protein EV1_023335 [Malus domestica]